MKHFSTITKRTLAFILFALFLSSFSIVFATDGWQSDFALPKWTYIALVSGGVMPDTDSSGRHIVGADVVLRDYNNRVELNATVQSFKGDWYNTSYKWSASGYSGVGIAEPIYLAPGSYRMRLIIKVYSPSNILLEETTLYTGDTVI